MDFSIRYYDRRNIDITTIWLLFFGVACMIISFLIVNSIDDSKPIDWNKVWRDSDNKFNQQKFDHINKRLDEVEKVSLSNI